MPLPSEEKIVQLANDLLAQLDAIFGLHPGFRPAHAKGIMLSGTFTPSPEAVSLTRAPHLRRSSTPVSVRFSNGTGLPSIPDNAPDSNPRGLAIRFHLADHVHTDIVSHSTDGFPTQTGQEFLEFLRAAAAGDLQQLPRADRPDGRRRIRHALRAEREGRRHRDDERGPDGWRSIGLSGYTPSRACVRADAEAKSHELRNGSLFWRDRLPLYQPEWTCALRPVSHYA